jgi:Lrp/AsnC family leucine-responsive transcriptional regulator
MDEIDVEILRILQKNARISVSDISNKVNLSVSAASERIKKLENSGVIKQYTTIINGAMMGKELIAMMSVSLERPQFTDGFMEFINKEDEVVECLCTAGGYDYVIKIVTKNTFTLEKFLTRIKSVVGVMKTNTNVVLSTVKINYSVYPEVEK